MIFTLATGIEIALLVGAGLSAAGALTGAVMGWQSAMFQKSAARQNARSAEAIANAEAEAVARDRQRRMGAMRAQIGASGVQFEGTPLEVLSEQAAEGALDEAITRYGGTIQSRNFRIEGTLAGQKGYASLIGGGLETGRRVATGLGRYLDYSGGGTGRRTPDQAPFN